MLKQKKKFGAVRQALGRFGFPFDDGKVKLEKTFQSVVTGIVSNEEHDTFLRLLKNAVGLMKRGPPVEEVARDPKKAKTFLTSKGNNFRPSPETIVEFFKNEPDQFASFHKIANITFSNTYKPCETDQSNIDALFAIHEKETEDKEDKRRPRPPPRWLQRRPAPRKVSANLLLWKRLLLLKKKQKKTLQSLAHLEKRLRSIATSARTRPTTSCLLMLAILLKCLSLEAPRRPRRILLHQIQATTDPNKKVELAFDLHDCRALVFELFGRALHLNCQQLSIFLNGLLFEADLAVIFDRLQTVSLLNWKIFETAIFFQKAVCVYSF